MALSLEDPKNAGQVESEIGCVKSGPYSNIIIMIQRAVRNCNLTCTSQVVECLALAGYCSRLSRLSFHTLRQ